MRRAAAAFGTGRNHEDDVYAQTHFAALKRVLDAEDPSYAQ